MSIQLYSTKHISPDVELREAVLRGLPPDNGLYMPYNMEPLESAFFESLEQLSFNDMAFKVLKHLFNGYIPECDLERIIESAFGFDSPIHWLEENIGVLELFHGPTLAFKDFGARFMGRLFEYFLKDNNQIIDILVATSGDTGSAVAHGFLNTKGIRVTILYPKGKVSEIQERQFATLGANIRVLEVEGTFDDCQRMVKKAFLDENLKGHLTLSSANSINIARLIPQSLYYIYGYGQIKNKDLPLYYSVPSGNFGNLTAGLFAKRLGLPIDKIIAGNNANSVFTEYCESGEYNPRPSVQTFSNAMDVGDPSNFKRILDIYKNDWNRIKTDIPAYTYSDDQTIQAIQNVHNQYGYVMCPHTAVGYLALMEYKKKLNKPGNFVVLSTAHPVKFQSIVEEAISEPVAIPERLKQVMGDEKLSVPIKNDYRAFTEFLMQNK